LDVESKARRKEEFGSKKLSMPKTDVFAALIIATLPPPPRGSVGGAETVILKRETFLWIPPLRAG
jgi:hypothetical protein